MLLQHLLIALIAIPALVAAAAVLGMEPGARGERRARVAWWAMMATVGVAMAVAGWISVSRLESLATSFALVDASQRLRPPGPRATRLLLLAGRVAFAVFGVAAVLLVARRRRVEAALRAAAGDVAPFRRAIAADLEGWRREAPRRHRVLLTVLVLLAAVTWLPLLLAPISYDEAITYIFFAARTPADIVSDYSMPNNHILHSLAAHLSTTVFGSSVVALRLPAFLAGVLLIPAIYWLTRRLFDSGSALIAAAIVCAAPVVGEYATQARGYTTVSLLTLVAFVLLTYLRERSSRTGWVLFAACVALSCFVVPTALYGLCIIGAWVALATPSTNPRWRREFVVWSAVAGAMVVVLYVPVVLRSGLSSLLDNEYVRARTLRGFVTGVRLSLVNAAECWAGPVPRLTGPVFALAAGFGLWVDEPVGRPARRLVAATVLGFALVLLLTRAAPPVRVLQVTFLLLVPVVAFGASRLLSLWRGEGASRRDLLAVGYAVVFGALAVARTQFMAFGVPTQRVFNPGAQDIRCCAEGFFVDAPAVAGWAARHARPRERIFTPPRSGWVQTTRYYLTREGMKATQLREFSTVDEVLAFASTGRLLLLAVPPAGDEAPAGRVASALGVSPRAMRETFDSVAVLRRFSLSGVYALYPKAVFRAARPPSDTGPSLIIPRTERRARREVGG